MDSVEAWRTAFAIESERAAKAEADRDALAALVREARALIDAPADDPRRAEFQARKVALLAEVEQ